MPPSILLSIIARLVLFAAIFLPAYAASVQDLTPSAHFSSQNGLSSTFVTCILQDEYGFLWIGTRFGLNKYDGHTFTVYQHDPSNANSLSNSVITSLYTDKQGILWIGANDGVLNEFNRKTNTIRHHILDSSQSNIVGQNNISIIYGDSRERLWCGTWRGDLYEFDKASGTSVRREYLDSAKKTAPRYRTVIRAIEEDSNDNIWVAENDVITRFGPKRDDVEIFDLHSIMEPSSYGTKQIILGATIDKDNRLWIATDNSGLSIFDRKTQKLIPQTSGWPTKNKRNWGTQVDLKIAPTGGVWLGTERGLFEFDSASGEFLHHIRMQNDDRRARLSFWFVATIMEHQTAWYGCNSGLYRYDLRPQRFATYAIAAAGVHSNQRRYIRAIFEESPERFWIGTDIGAFEFKPNDINQWRLRRDLSLNKELLQAVNVILQDRFGELWFGPSAGGIAVLNPKTGAVRKYVGQHLDTTTINSGVFSLFEDRRGVIWIGTEQGLLRYNRHTDDFTRFYDMYVDDPESRFYVFDICEDRQGRIWVATSAGIKIFDRALGRYTRTFAKNSDINAGPSVNDVWTLHEDKRGVLWVGVHGGGLLRYIPASDSFKTYTESDGLASNGVFGILEDDAGNLWITTTNGLSRFDPVAETFRTYDAADGLLDKEFYFGAYHRGKHTGRLYVGGRSGFSAFDPDSLRDRARIPPVVITACRVSHNALEREILPGDTVILEYPHNTISFEFAALDYSNPGKQQYAYRLDGIDDSWVYCGSRRYASYPHLESGAYTFRVKGANNAGQWNEKGASLAVMIRPPWWGTGLFRFAVGLVIAGSLGWLAYTRLHEAQLIRKTLESRLQSLRLQLNPHFIFNSLVSIQHCIMNRDPEAAYDQVARFAGLMRIILEQSGQQAITLAQELEMLQLYLELEKQRSGGVLVYDIAVDPTVDPNEQTIPPILLQPYVENAIIHGLWSKTDDARLYIRIHRVGDRLRCIIEDNGIGREESRKRREKKLSRRRSSGMRVAQERLDILSARSRQSYKVQVLDLFDDSGAPAGTSIELDIPAD